MSTVEAKARRLYPHEAPNARRSPRYIKMDGEKHSYDDSECSCDALSCEQWICSRCNVYLHAQPVYGGYYWQCPECMEIF